MEEQVLFNQIKSLIEKGFNEIKVENDKLKKEIQELKGTLTKNIQLDKVDLEHLSQNSLNGNAQTTDYKLIDLGLPSGTLWMDRNIGASSPSDGGLYFAWGETTGYTADEVGKTKEFSWTDYKHCKGECNTLTKYCWNDGYGNYDYADSLVTLQPCEDVVYLLTNGKCSIPTREQIQELLDNTTYGWSAIGGVNGGVFTSKTNGNFIFVPANGMCGFGSVYGIGKGGSLWSNSLDKSYSIKAWHLYFSNREFDITNGEAICGYSDKAFGIAVRGVSLKK